MSGSRLNELVQSFKPETLLDVGCGCGGHLTSSLVRHCPRVVAIDTVSHARRWREIAGATGVVFCRMDATSLAFDSGSFPVVLERASLHHIAQWTEALAEMVRVTSDRLLLEEPVDDLRSLAKARTYEAQGLFLRLQAEVGYPHHRHLETGALLSALQGHPISFEIRIERSDAPVAFEPFFESFPSFASRSDREGYWQSQLDELRARYAGAPLCEDDTITILAVRTAPSSRSSRPSPSRDEPCRG